MVNEHHVKSYEEFTALVEGLEADNQPIHVLFSGGKDENGISWCPYCVTGECARYSHNKQLFLYVFVCSKQPHRLSRRACNMRRRTVTLCTATLASVPCKWLV